MKAILKTDYQRCFADWKKRWLKSIAANGDYFEGDNLNLERNGKIRKSMELTGLPAYKKLENILQWERLKMMCKKTKKQDEGVTKKAKRQSFR
ncbi:hypothetical protein LAZ67_23001028 [Cordylochernes scorpioides]|uniref:Uncharacterized protein n=1 Tax=Cordylochernes scorpioides TaxID=51811 RepID=A0ABY6LQE7_9ARAC|nr:hypothetical protein LAZ67_23001028 [Cordylochernes scorpioides]